ncbi:MAG TPA: MFS transporter [Thermoanaerobaculia bacterium]|nr:MFS transporter [Thermoanaerobaculia bacterium]
MLRALFANLKALPRATWILFAGTFINRFGTFVMPFLAIYMSRRGFTPAQAGLAVSAYGGGHIVAAMLGGHLADRIGRRNTIVMSMFASMIVMLALSQARTLTSIIALAFLAASAAELYRPAASALLGDLVPPEQRIAAFGMYRFAVNLGFAAGPATAGFLAGRSFFYVFAGDALTSLIFGLVAVFALPHGLRSHPKDEIPGEGLRVALRDRAFVYFLAATLCLTFIDFQLHSTIPLHITSIGYTTATYGLLLSINGVMIVLFELVLTAWTQRFPARPLIALGYGLNSLGVALMGFLTSMPALTMSVVVWTLGEMIFAPASGAFVSGLAPERYRGRYMGLWHLMFSLGMLLGPAIGTWIYGRSHVALFWTCIVVGAASVLLALLKPNN